MNIELKEYSQFFEYGFTISPKIGELQKIKEGYIMFSTENSFWAETPSWNFNQRKNLTLYEFQKETGKWKDVKFYGNVWWDGKGWKGKESGYIAKTA